MKFLVELLILYSLPKFGFGHLFGLTRTLLWDLGFRKLDNLGIIFIELHRVGLLVP